MRGRDCLRSWLVVLAGLAVFGVAPSCVMAQTVQIEKPPVGNKEKPNPEPGGEQPVRNTRGSVQGEELKRKYEDYRDFFDKQREEVEKAKESGSVSGDQKPLRHLGGSPLPETVALHAAIFIEHLARASMPFGCTDFKPQCVAVGLKAGLFGLTPAVVPMKVLRQPTQMADCSQVAYQMSLVDSIRVGLEHKLTTSIVLQPGFTEQLIKTRISTDLIALQRGLALQGGGNFKLNLSPEIPQETLKQISEQKELGKVLNFASANGAWCTGVVPIFRNFPNPNPLLRVRMKKATPLEYAMSSGVKFAPAYLGGIPTTLAVGGKFRKHMETLLSTDPLACLKNQIFSQEGDYKALNVAAPLVTSANAKRNLAGFGKGGGCRVPLSPSISGGSPLDGAAKVASGSNMLDVACLLTKKFYDVRDNDKSDDRWQFHGESEDGTAGSITNHECAPIDLGMMELAKANNTDNPPVNMYMTHWTRFSEVQGLVVVFFSTCPVVDRKECASE